MKREKIKDIQELFKYLDVQCSMSVRREKLPLESSLNTDFEVDLNGGIFFLGEKYVYTIDIDILLSEYSGCFYQFFAITKHLQDAKYSAYVRIFSKSGLRIESDINNLRSHQNLYEAVMFIVTKKVNYLDYTGRLPLLDFYMDTAESLFPDDYMEQAVYVEKCFYAEETEVETLPFEFGD